MIKIWNFERGLRGLRVFWLCEEMGLEYQVEITGYPLDEGLRARNAQGYSRKRRPARFGQTSIWGTY